MSKDEDRPLASNGIGAAVIALILGVQLKLILTAIRVPDAAGGRQQLKELLLAVC